MHAGDDVREHDDSQPVVGRQQEPRGHQRRMRRYGTYLRLVIVSLVVGLAVGVWSGWNSMPPLTFEIPQTCYEWNRPTTFLQMPNSQTDCVDGVKSGAGLSLDLGGTQRRVIRLWHETRTWRTDLGPWALTAVRNGLIAAGVAYLVLILIVVPARMLKRPD